MTTLRRSAVLVVLSNAVGHELVFSHYTNKVVVGKYLINKPSKSQGAKKRKQ